MRPRFNASRAKARGGEHDARRSHREEHRLAKLRAEDGGEHGDREAYPGHERGAQGRLDAEDPPLAAMILGGHRHAAPRPEPPAPRGPTCSTLRPPRRSTCAPPPPSGDRRGSPPSRGHALAPERDGKCALPPGHGKGPLPPVPVDRLRLRQTARPPSVPLETAQERPEVGQEPDEHAAADAGAARVDPRAKRPRPGTPPTSARAARPRARRARRARWHRPRGPGPPRSTRA